MSGIDSSAVRAGTWGGLACGLLVAALLAGAGPRNALAQSAPYVYPSQGQSMEEQARDESECRMFAQQNTGFNPSQGPAYYPQQSTGGEMVGGAARGAALGAIGGAIGGNAGKGAAIGAGVGAAAGLLRRAQKDSANQQAQQQAQADYNNKRNNYNRAFGACMQGRGYAVN
jgi:hypothetical protein